MKDPIVFINFLYLKIFTQQHSFIKKFNSLMTLSRWLNDPVADSFVRHMTSKHREIELVMCSLVPSHSREVPVGD